MININAQNIKQAWSKSLRELYDRGEASERGEFYRFSPAFIQVEDTKDEHYDEFYPLPVADIANGNRYLITGEGEGSQDEISRAYRERLFGGEDMQNQIARAIDYLRRSPSGKNALLSLREPEDIEMDQAPELSTILFRITDGALDAHVHSTGSNAYRNLLPNMSRFATLQHHVAERLGIPHGKYIYFDNSLHFHMDDRDHVDLLLAP